MFGNVGSRPTRRAQRASAGTFKQYEFTATAAQTIFQGVATVGGRMTYVPGNVLCFVNSMKVNQDDFTATDGLKITLTKACSAGDQVVIVAITAQASANTATLPPTESTALNTGATTGTGGFVSGTYTTPANVKWLRVRMVGGGAGGWGSGTGTGTTSVAGGNTTFGTNTASGGAISATFSGAGGLGGATTINAGSGTGVSGGQGGGAGFNASSGCALTGTPGGQSALGGAGSASNVGVAGQAGAANTGGGGGGGGTSTTANVNSGAAGGAGGFIDVIIVNPAATYSYSVGTGGTGGGAGASGFVGGAGGTGGIWVEEYYGTFNIINNSVLSIPQTLTATQQQQATTNIGAPSLATTNSFATANGLQVAGKKAVNGPAFSAYLSTSQTGLTNGVYTKVNIDTKTFDTDTCFDAVTNRRFTPTVEGYYAVSATIQVSGTLTAALAVIYKNGAAYCLGNYMTTAAVNACLNCASVIYMNGTTDYLELYGLIVGSASLAFAGGSTVTQFSASMIRGA